MSEVPEYSGVPVLSLFQLLVFGFLNNSNVSALSDALMVFHYSDSLGVSAAVLGLIHLVVAFAAAYGTG